MSAMTMNEVRKRRHFRDMAVFLMFLAGPRITPMSLIEMATFAKSAAIPARLSKK